MKEDTAVEPVPTVDEPDVPEPEEPEPVDTAITQPEPEPPIAVCSASPNPVSPPFESADWLGGRSYDPGGYELIDYQWRLASKPAGSAVSMPPSTGGTNREGFVPDLAGDYVGELIVTNEIGLMSEPCEAILEAIPAENLWVEVYWSHPNDDFDLHLVRDGGNLNSNNDCHYGNCTGPNYPDWGVAGVADDDPALDLDDIEGVGPENINIGEPAEGIYQVAVQDYRWSGQTYQGANAVTVNVYIDGAQVFSDTRDISGEGSTTWFVEIDWATGAITPM